MTVDAITWSEIKGSSELLDLALTFVLAGLSSEVILALCATTKAIIMAALRTTNTIVAVVARP